VSKLMAVTCALLLILSGWPQKERFAKYKTIEAYEIRPGILAMPKYTGEGQVCEVGLERLHYSPEKITLYSSLKRKMIDEVTEELVPANERGQKSEDKLDNLITVTGTGMVTNVGYENIRIQILSAVSHASGKQIVADNVAAIIQWKNRKCN